MSKILNKKGEKSDKNLPSMNDDKSSKIIFNSSDIINKYLGNICKEGELIICYEKFSNHHNFNVLEESFICYTNKNNIYTLPRNQYCDGKQLLKFGKTISLSSDSIIVVKFIWKIILDLGIIRKTFRPYEPSNQDENIYKKTFGILTDALPKMIYDLEQNINLYDTLGETRKTIIKLKGREIEKLKLELSEIKERLFKKEHYIDVEIEKYKELNEILTTENKTKDMEINKLRIVLNEIKEKMVSDETFDKEKMYCFFN
jgi:hypothetical protein